MGQHVACAHCPCCDGAGGVVVDVSIVNGTVACIVRFADEKEEPFYAADLKVLP